MAIRIELYVKDQVEGSAMLEYILRSGGILQAYTEIEAPLAQPPPPKPPPKSDSYSAPTKPHKPKKQRPRLDYDGTWYRVIDSNNPVNPGSKRHAYIATILRTQGARTLRDIFNTVKQGHSVSSPSSVREIIRALIRDKYLEPTSKPVAAPVETPKREIAQRMDYVTTIVRVVNRANDCTKGSIRWNQQNIILSFRKDMSLREILTTVIKRMKLTDQQESAVRSEIRNLIRKGNLEIVE